MVKKAKIKKRIDFNDFALEGKLGEGGFGMAHKLRLCSFRGRQDFADKGNDGSGKRRGEEISDLALDSSLGMYFYETVNDFVLACG